MSLTGDVLGQIGAEVSMNGGVGGTIQFTGEGTDNYDELDNRPSINGVVLTGNKTTEDLHIPTGGTDDYPDLNNKPKINGVTLRGDVSSASLQIPYDDLINRPVIPDLTDLENRMDAVEGDIQAIETDIGDIGDRLIDIASDIATIQATDLVQNSDISSLKNRMNAAETSITNLGSRLTTAEGTISTHTTDINDLDSRLDTAEDNISDAQNDISDLQGDVTSLDTIVGNGQQTVGSDLTDAVTQLNSSLTNSTTYSTDTTERVLIGYKQGKPLYRQYLTYSNLTVPVNTEQILTSASIPSGAGNISISDKSYIETGTTRMNACCAYSNVYSVGTSIRWRQTYSSGSSWNLYIWVEYTLPN